MGNVNPPQEEQMGIHRNEFTTFQEVMEAVNEFPRCGQCKGWVKPAPAACVPFTERAMTQQFHGNTWVAVCTNNPRHHSMRRVDPNKRIKVKNANGKHHGNE